MSRSVYTLGKINWLIPLFPCQRLTFRQLNTDNGHTTTVVTGRWRRFWRNWVPIPTGVGVTVLAVLQWRRLQRQRNPDQGVAVARNWQIVCYRAIPCRALSRAWGWVSSRHVPGPLRSWVYGLYSSMYGVNLDEMAGDINDYTSLAQFFTRQLKAGVRPIDPSDCIVSPADGRVLNCGKVCSCNIEQIKGVTYSIQTFLGEPSWRPKQISQQYQMHNSKFIKEITKDSNETDENDNKIVPKKYEVSSSKAAETLRGGRDLVSYLMSAGQEPVRFAENEDWKKYKNQLLENPENELYQTVVYLAPGDYHRFHSPVHWKVNFRRHFQGELLSVNPAIAGWVPELFSLNERVVYAGQWEHGFFSMTAVGATNVGSIRVHSDKSLHTNSRRWRDGARHKDRIMNVNWSKGEEVGEFRMGSTIVLIFEAPKNYWFNIKSKEQVRVGQNLCCVSCDQESKSL